MKFMSILLIGVICVACGPTNSVIRAESLWNNPIPPPDWVQGLDAYYDRAHEPMQVCILVSEAELWEPDNEGGDIYQAFVQSFQVRIDNVALASGEVRPMQIATSIARYDDLGNYLGSHGGGIQVCINIENLSLGLHSAYLTFESTSGKSYLYQWAFKLERQPDGRTHIVYPAQPE